MKKYLKGLIVFVIMFFPVMVNAEEITTAKAPEYISEENVFVANGTPIVIEEKDGSTYATWEGGEQLLNESAIVVGGYCNPLNSGSDNVIDLESTSVTMNSGTVGVIVGGNAIDANYDVYSKIHVGTINVDINGGTLSEVSAVSIAHDTINTALGSSYYDKITSYYYADKVNISVSAATVTYRIYVLSSYTYAKDVEINISDGAVIRDGYYAIAVGTNGKVSNFVVNVDDSTVDQIHSGFRTMVDYMEVNLTGNTVVGDIYAGSYYSNPEKSNKWVSLGSVDYGQVAKMEFNIDKDVKYNDIYAGFQFATLNGKSEYDTFYEKYASDSAVNSVAEGFGKDVKTAPVTINVASTPTKVTTTDTEGLESMFDAKYDNVTVVYNTTPEVPTVDPSEEVEEPTFGIIDNENIGAILGASIANNEKVTEALNKGQQVTTEVAIGTVKKPANEDVAKIEEALTKIEGDSTVAGYYDISVLVKADGTEIDRLTSISEPISLTIVLPTDLQEVAEGYTRTYYVARIHDGEVELLETTLADDGKSLTFETDSFSTYALTYVDSLASEEEPDTETPTTPEVPQTFDSLITYVIGGVVSIALIAGAVLYIKKKQTN